MKLAPHRSALNAELQRVDLRLRALEAPAPDVHGDDADMRVGRQGQEDLVVERAQLTELRGRCISALLRIEKRTYGECLSCCQPIPAKRLEALPWVERCVECEARREESIKRQAASTRPLDMTPGDEGQA